MTYDQPVNYTKSIYFYGPCFIYGHYVEDKNTIESFLQKHLNESGEAIRVVNCGIPGNSTYTDFVLMRIMNTQLKKGDTVILFANSMHFPGIQELNFAGVLEKYNINEQWMVDQPIHCNHKINLFYARAIYDAIASDLKENDVGQGELVKCNIDGIKHIYIDKFFPKFDVMNYKKIGAIVMNCNPFTYGHQHLIEKALTIVDFLIIFVVEEDRSIFSFSDRFSMVIEATSSFDNVKVVPSGAFILSQITFPEYFIKQSDESIEFNIENDIKLFAESIAPKLNIQFRFVGEELEDEITNKYNFAMKRLLPHYGIKLVEIPRKRQNGQYIKAERVRKCLENNDISGLKGLIPESTARILGLEIDS